MSYTSVSYTSVSYTSVSYTIVTDPSEIKKGTHYRVVANAGHFDHLMRVTSTYNGFFMLETASGGRHSIGWNSMRNGDVGVYRLDPDKKVEPVTAAQQEPQQCRT